MHKKITITNIANILAQQLDTFVDAPFEALVTQATPQPTKGSAKCILVDPKDHTKRIQGCFWGVDPVRYEGMIVNFSGKGMRRGEYNNIQQVNVGQSAKLSIVSSAGAAQSPAGTAGIHMPVAQTQTETQTQKQTQTQTASSGKINFNEEIGKISALYQLAYKQAALLKAMNEMSETPFSDKQFESCVASIFISAERKGLANHLPSTNVAASALNVSASVESEENPF
jgi:hypothetical protein